ncbi:hypothetical protein HDU98_007371 [Podochytrium sp. JEL0797]|nr:hypothetical protein HDU98_007371 [Podochytrium sp. JEL0797]
MFTTLLSLTVSAAVASAALSTGCQSALTTAMDTQYKCGANEACVCKVPISNIETICANDDPTIWSPQLISSAYTQFKACSVSEKLDVCNACIEIINQLNTVNTNCMYPGIGGNCMCTFPAANIETVCKGDPAKSWTTIYDITNNYQGTVCNNNNGPMPTVAVETTPAAVKTTEAHHASQRPVETTTKAVLKKTTTVSMYPVETEHGILTGAASMNAAAFAGVAMVAALL